MVASLNKTWATDPYTGDQLGTSTALGTGFLRQITITMTGVVSYAFVADDFGLNQIYNIISIIGDTSTNTGYYVTASTAAGFTLNAPQESVVKVIVLGRGI